MDQVFRMFTSIVCFRHFINGLFGGIVLQALLMAWIWETIQRFQFNTFLIKDVVFMASCDLIASFLSLFVGLQ